jgi:hypothetical protein
MNAPVTTASLAADSPTPAAPAVARQPTPTAHDNQAPPNPYAIPPADRWGARTAAPPATPRNGTITNDQFSRLDPAEQAKYANVRGANGTGGEWVPRNTLPSESGTDPAKTAAPGEASVTKDGKLRVGEHELGPEDIAGLMERRALEAVRATQVPADGVYEAKLPEAVKLPGDVKFEVNREDPAFKDLQAFAARTGLSQDQMSEVLAIYAGDRARDELVMRTAIAKNISALGANANARVSAVDQWIRGVVGDELGKEMRHMVVSEKIVRGFEKLISKFTSQGVASFRQDGREPQGAPGRVSEAEYNAMSGAERYAYAKSFPQSQFK